MSSLQAVLRTMLLSSLLDIARCNVSKGQADLRLFETGNVYEPIEGKSLPRERLSLCVLVHGAVADCSWSDRRPVANSMPAKAAFAAKGALELLAQALRVDIAVDQAFPPEPFLHPGQSGRVLAGGEDIGWIGALHPMVADTWTLDDTGCFELDLDRLLGRAQTTPLYQDRLFRTEEQDFSVVVACDVPAHDVLEAVRRHAVEAKIVGLFTGEQIPASEKSVAVRCAFPVPAETGQRAEHLAAQRAHVIASLAEIGGRID